MSNAWKDLERKTAKAFGGKRVLRGANFSKSAPDIEHPVFAIECKLRNNLPGYLKTWLWQARKYNGHKTPILVIKPSGEEGELVVMTMKDFISRLGPVYLKGRGEDDEIETGPEAA